MDKVTVWSISCQTGCTCCSYENFNRGFFRDKSEAEHLVSQWREGKDNPLGSQYATYGRYSIEEHEAEILPDGRMIIDGFVYSENYFGDGVL